MTWVDEFWDFLGWLFFDEQVEDDEKKRKEQEAANEQDGS